MYLQMSSWALNQGYDGISKFMYKQSREELDHMQKLFDYINKTGSMAIVPDVIKSDLKYLTIKDLFEIINENERHVTQCINHLVDLSLKSKDFSTFNFLQWYVSEQHEEEALFKGILDKINLIGENKFGVYTLDKAIGEMV